MPSIYLNDGPTLTQAEVDTDALKLVVKRTFLEAYESTDEVGEVKRQNSAPALLSNVDGKASKTHSATVREEAPDTPLLKCSSLLRTPSTSSFEDEGTHAQVESSQPEIIEEKSKKAAEAVETAPSAQAEPAETRTTLMLRNLPEDLRQPHFVQLLNIEGFMGCYDFVYMPLNLTTSDNFGYVFVNLMTPEIAQWCLNHFQDFSHWTVQSNKRCNPLWSDIQGKDACINRYRNSPIMHKSIPLGCQPALYDNTGHRLPFPEPTVKIKEPRIRRPEVPAGIKKMTKSVASATTKATASMASATEKATASMASATEKATASMASAATKTTWAITQKMRKRWADY